MFPIGQRIRQQCRPLERIDSTKLDSLGMRATLLSQHVVDIIAIACDFVFLIKRQPVRIEGGLAGPQVLYNCFEKPVLRQPNIYISMSFMDSVNTTHC